ncbi:hypothetical protein MHB40_14530 [Lysinibacillus sp. FSL K6-0057]|uniref:hypothetical protein n=1 Tax=Lysinibacillus sp. FSL K6-0057 TaxID=2921411 RepID=UPI003159DC98
MGNQAAEWIMNETECESDKNVLWEIEQVMMKISIRKTELIDKHRIENLCSPDFTDLNWCYEQLYYLKKEIQ